MYILAGYETTYYIVKYFLDEFSEQTNEFFASKIDGNLITFAHNLSKLNTMKTEKDAIEYGDWFAEQLEMMHNEAKCYRRRCYIDSGGFQISVGLVKEEVLPLMKTAYMHFLSKYDNLYDRAFSLDIIPNEFSGSIDEYIKLNKFGLMEELLGINNKIIRIYHFIPPGLLNVFAPLHIDLYRNEKFDKNDVKLAVGGLVIYDRKTSKLYADAYISALIYLIKLFEYATGEKLKKLEFHALGVSNPTDVVKIRFTEKIIKKLLNIDLTITHDSSKIFKSIIKSKMVDYFDSDRINLIELDLTSKNMDNVKYHKKSNLELFLNEFESLNLPDDFRKSFLPLYVLNKNTNKVAMRRLVDCALIMFETYQIQKLNEKLEDAFSDCNDVKDYFEAASEFLRKFHSKQYFNKSMQQLVNSVKMIYMDVFEIKKLLESMFEYENNTRFTFLKNYRYDLKK